MPPPADTNGGLRPKPTTRSSIRHSLNLASMGKAFADVMHKEGKDPDKLAKKAKENASSRRLSAVKPAPRASMGDSKPPTPATTISKAGTPDSKTITRRRTSVAIDGSSDDQPANKPTTPQPPISGVTRSATLRPRTSTGKVQSALPKYRPKSVAMELGGLKPPSPARAGTRRRLSSSDEDREDKKATPGVEEKKTRPSLTEKLSRPISPLPQRATIKINLSAMNVKPSTPPPKKKIGTPTSTKTSPSRPTKHVKSASGSASAIPRPPSSTSSAGSFTPRTPKSSSLKGTLGLKRSGRENIAAESSPLRLSPFGPPDSPLSRRSGKTSTGSNTPTSRAESNLVGNMSHISEGDSEDSSDADDVELLLAPVAPLAAPTPSMPRILKTSTRQRLQPHTPTRPSSNLPSRANLSYLSPLPPGDNGSPSLRPQRPAYGNEKMSRGSILSWEQLATEASRTLGEDEIDSMLADIPAPFRPGSVSPASASMLLDIPESPCLSALPSPGGYGSISQVLLPEVTPSPAPQHYHNHYDLSTSTVDASIATLLRLQLASAENTAKERLAQLQRMEEELHSSKEGRLRDVEDLSAQVAFLEEQMRGNLEAREKTDEERAAYTASLEEQLRHAVAYREQAIREAVAENSETARQSRESALQLEKRKWEAACVARVASAEWASVRHLAESELDILKGDMDVLSVLLAELDKAQRQICMI